MSYAGPPNYSAPQGSVTYDFFQSISESWGLVMSRIGDYLVMGLILALSQVAVQFGYSLFTLGFSFEGLQGYDIFSPGYFIDLLTTFLGSGVINIVVGGLTLYAIKQVRGEQVSLSDLGKGMQNVVALLVSGVVINICVTIGTMLCCLPGLILGGVFMLTTPLIVDRGLGPFEAMSESWRMLSQQWLKSGLFYLVIGIVAALGVLACVVGLLFTVPMMYVAFAVIYVRMTQVAVVPVSVSPYPRAGSTTVEHGSQPVPPPNEQEPPKPEDVG